MTHYRDSAYFSKLISLEGIPKEFLPNLDDNDSVVTDPQFVKNEDESEREANGFEAPEKEETVKKTVDRKLEWPLCCWICRQPITKKKSYIICTDMCKRSYHNRCHDFMKNYYRSIYDKVTANKKSAPSNNISEFNIDLSYFNDGSVFASDPEVKDEIDDLSTDSLNSCADDSHTFIDTLKFYTNTLNTDDDNLNNDNETNNVNICVNNITNEDVEVKSENGQIKNGNGQVNGNREVKNENEEVNDDVQANDNVKVNENGKAKSEDVHKKEEKTVDSVKVESSEGKKCFFCSISHVGCNGCRQFFVPKNLVKCCIEECTTFYCYPNCLSNTRIIIPDKKVIDINMSMCGHLHNLVDANGRPKFICHSHTCWSCYDCDRYSYYWETFWRNEYGKGNNAALVSAWNTLKSSCRGKVESSHFAKGKKIAKPQRYPDVRGFKTFIQSKAYSAFSTNSDELYYSSDDDEEYFQKGPSSILLKCIRCDRTWCTHCVHPDVHIVPKSGKQILCQDCIHVQIGCTLAQNSRDSSNISNIVKRECIYPVIRLDTSVPTEIFTQLKNFITEHSNYEKKLNLEPTFISKHPAQDSDDDSQLLDLHKSILQRAKSRRNKKGESNSTTKSSQNKTAQQNKTQQTKTTNQQNKTPSQQTKTTTQQNSKTTTNQNNKTTTQQAKTSQQNLKFSGSKEWNNIIKNSDESILSKISSEFRYVTSNVISAENRKLVIAPEAEMKCHCDKKCGSDCSNVMKNTECTVKNCNLMDENCGNRRFLNFTGPKLKLNYVDGKGVGTVATEDINEGELVCEYVGEVISQADFQRCLASASFAEIDDGNQSHWYVMKIQRDTYIDSTHLGNVARFINHSCDPNCASVPINVRGTYRMGVFAQRKIKQGEEVTYNYGFTSKGVGGGFRCRCRAKNCRGIIGSQLAHSPESLMSIEASKYSGAEADVLSQLTTDMSSLTVANKTQSLKQQPSPLDVLNGIWTCGDLHRYEKIVEILDKDTNSTGSTLNNPLRNLLADNAHVSEAQFNYVKLLTLNSMSFLDFDIANTKKFATNIPWALVAMGHKDISIQVVSSIIQLIIQLVDDIVNLLYS
ncbi:uncharacterized protein TA09850 [Theileria annulata]|uniref:SET domain containing protein n=1 Tax=Theileria annulata TaxID=5874 RepID=Q4U8N4_THEAN|nr:uncharacterized protein TA09850 [Theileria annulata]CAI76819.1 hypothetical protein, conserved [Theileria annulata]|eukprot:XP_953444.1 hypothetical protein, conserved [Theileria annulata]